MGLIEFKDKGFEKVVKATLKTTARKLTKEDLLNIKGLLIADKQTNGFAVPWSADSSAYNMVFPNLMFSTSDSENGLWELDLAYFSHIKSLHLYSPTINLSFLAGFGDLNELYVEQSRVKDWSFIGGLLSLSNLYIVKCDFHDLEVIRELCLKQQEIVEIEYARGEGFKYAVVPRLSNLGLSYCGISDISPLAACKLISELNLSHNEISDLRPLTTMSSLYYVTLRYNKLIDVEPLKGLKRVYSLNLRHNQITDISALVKLKAKGLSRLYLDFNEIQDFSPLEDQYFVDCDFGSRGR